MYCISFNIIILNILNDVHNSWTKEMRTVCVNFSKPRHQVVRLVGEAAPSLGLWTFKWLGSFSPRFENQQLGFDICLQDYAAGVYLFG